MMLRVTGFLLLLGWISQVGGAQGAPGATVSLCLPADSSGLAVVAFAKGFIGDTSASSVAVRDSLGLSNLTANDVSLSSDRTACSKASKELDALSANVAMASAPATGRQVYLVAVGRNHFFVQDPNGRTDEGNPMYLFDTHFSQVLYVLLGP